MKAQDSEPRRHAAGPAQTGSPAPESVSVGSPIISKPALVGWFVPLVSKHQSYRAYFKHPDGLYHPAPADYVFEPDRGGWTHPAFATPKK